MSGPQSPLAALPDAVTKAAVDAELQTVDDNLIIKKLIEVTTDFLSITSRDTLFGKGDPNPDAYKPSLGNLFARLQAGRVPPSPVEVHCDSKKTDRIRKRSSKSLDQRPLRDYEDIYYALLALTQEMYSILRMRINNGFNSFHDTIYEDGHQIVQVIGFLFSTWKLLNTPAVAKALDDAIRKASFKKSQKRLNEDLKEGLYTVEDVNDLLKELEDPSMYKTIPGLNWVGGWSPAMINVMLEQKYRRMFSFDRKEKLRKAREGAIRKREAKAAVERDLKKRLSAEQLQREELLKTQLQEEAKSRQAQLHTEMHVQTPLHLEQQSEERKMAARASLVLDYMNNLRNKASPRAKRLMHATVANNPPPVYRGSPSPSGYSTGSTHRDNIGSALKQGFGASGLIGNDVFGTPSGQVGSASHTHGGYTNMNVSQGFVGSAPTGEHGYGSSQARYDYPVFENKIGYTTQDKQFGYATGISYYGNQEVVSHANPVSQQDPASNTYQGSSTDQRFSFHNAQDESILVEGPTASGINAKETLTLALPGTCTHNMSAGFAQQGFQWAVAENGTGHMQDGGSSTGVDIEMNMGYKA